MERLLAILQPDQHGESTTAESQAAGSQQDDSMRSEEQAAPKFQSMLFQLSPFFQSAKEQQPVEQHAFAFKKLGDCWRLRYVCASILSVSSKF